MSTVTLAFSVAGVLDATASIEVTSSGMTDTRISALTAGTGPNLTPATVVPATDGAGNTVKYTTAQLQAQIGLPLINPLAAPYSAAGNGTTDDRGALFAANAAAASAGGALLIAAGTFRIASNLTLTAPIVALPGGLLSVDSGNALTIGSTVDAGGQRLFTGSGSVVFAGLPNPDVNVKWFGAKGDSLTDDSAAFTKAIASLSTAFGQGGRVLVPAGFFNLATTGITLASNVRLVCAGSRQTFLIYTGTGNAVTGTDIAWSGLVGCRIALNSSGSGVRGVKLLANGASVLNNFFDDIVIIGGIGVVGSVANPAGQVGWWEEVVGGNIVSENVINRLTIDSIAKPVYLYGSEGNFRQQWDIARFGNGASPVAYDAFTHDEPNASIRIAAVGFGVTTPIGYQQQGSRNIVLLHSDIAGVGIGQSLNITGVGNTAFLTRAAGATPVGTISASTTLIDADQSVLRRPSANGTALVAGDFVLSGGFGNTATVGTVTGNDSRFRFTVTSAGTGQGANPTITLTFKDGTWTTAPFATVSRGGGSQNTIPLSVSTTATTCVITFQGTPVAAETYVITGHVLG